MAARGAEKRERGGEDEDATHGGPSRWTPCAAFRPKSGVESLESEMVEPGGIAPPSERTSPQASTCVALSVVSSLPLKTVQNQPGPAPGNLAATVRSNQWPPAR